MRSDRWKASLVLAAAALLGAAAPAQAPFVSAASPLFTGEQPDGAWWRLFDDPLLERMVNEALARNTDLRVAEANLRRSFQRIGLVRFNPFEDTGGNQSFALALLDANGDGIVFSSLHSRTGTRVYAKAVNGGRSETALSDEETQAVRDAMAGGTARTSGAV